MLHKPSSPPGLFTACMSHVSINGLEAMSAIVFLVISAARPVPFSREQLVTSDMIIANEPQESVRDLCQVLAVDAPEKVVVLAKDTPSRRVRRTYEDFWRRVAAEAPDIVLYHTDCFETLILWLESMCSSPIRALRLSASFAAYRLVDGFIEVGTQLRKRLASIQRQLSTEKRDSGISQRNDSARGAKKRPAQGKEKKKELSPKGKALANKVDELNAKNSEITELSDRVYRSIFIDRHRDIYAEVRSMSLSALGG
ncbi:Cohesin subunit SA-3 [Gracilariopsis chorda]|uniref:Cohesin subunit SA-3 n=1 Tax=Gracilariopsis chorda TaxID=448386 RepID=A0A2V3IFY1_9FLOR|nr:Cohesin subunit SA-3 [Gracilariopsis chorda]|eukprot:PXF40977.1 Cohesin subunit SA-3 [Gracilariopsis chorda]